jgi:hypothetical protein
MPTSFEDLPPEIRLMIYRLILPDNIDLVRRYTDDLVPVPGLISSVSSMMFGRA